MAILRPSLHFIVPCLLASMCVGAPTAKAAIPALSTGLDIFSRVELDASSRGAMAFAGFASNSGTTLAQGSDELFPAANYPQCPASAGNPSISAVVGDCFSCIGTGSCPESCCANPVSKGGGLVVCKVGTCCVRFTGLQESSDAIAVSVESFETTKEVPSNSDGNPGSCIDAGFARSTSCKQCAVLLDRSTEGTVDCSSGGIDVPAGTENTVSNKCAKGGGSTPATTTPTTEGETGTRAGGSPGIGGGAGNNPVTVAPTTTTKEEGSSDDKKCFASHATVVTIDGRAKRMDELQIGDQVQVGPSQFSAVYAFTHRDHKVESEYVRIATEGGESIAATPGHYIYINGALAPIRAARVGDFVTSGTGATSTISHVSLEKGQGLFNPQTVHGDIVVDGVLASTYTTAVSPSVAHALLMPLRAAYELLGTGVSLFDEGLPRMLRA